MTKKLEELFDLPSTPAVEQTPVTDSVPEISPQVLDDIDKIEAALPQVRGLEASDGEMDDLAKKATDSYQDLLDLGMNVDARYSAEILSVASQMLGHAITAKTAKINKKLKMIDMQMKKLALDRKASAPDAVVTPLDGQGHVLNRNELLERLLGKTNKKE